MVTVRYLLSSEDKPPWLPAVAKGTAAAVIPATFMPKTLKRFAAIRVKDGAVQVKFCPTLAAAYKYVGCRFNSVVVGGESELLLYGLVTGGAASLLPKEKLVAVAKKRKHTTYRYLTTRDFVKEGDEVWLGGRRMWVFVSQLLVGTTPDMEDAPIRRLFR